MFNCRTIILPPYLSSSAISLPLALFAWTDIYGAAIAELCEYGGTQNRPEHDVMPMDMPPMVPGSIVGIRPCLALA